MWRLRPFDTGLRCATFSEKTAKRHKRFSTDESVRKEEFRKRFDSFVDPMVYNTEPHDTPLQVVNNGVHRLLRNSIK